MNTDSTPRRIASRLSRDTRFPGIVAALAALIVYLRTMSPAIGWEADTGELAAAFATLGIPHPSGYPLFTPLAWLFSNLPLGDRVILRLNLLVALLCALAVYLFYRVFVLLLSGELRDLFAAAGGSSQGKDTNGKNADKANNAKGRRPSDTPGHSGSQAPAPGTPTAGTGLTGRLWAAAGAALMLAFSKTFWSESVSIEVYAFHLVLTAGVLELFLRALSAQRVAGRVPSSVSSSVRQRDARWLWAAFALALGLSFAHHLMTVMLAPAFLYLFFVTFGFGRGAWKQIALAVPPFLLGLATYLYLPLRAAQGPVMNWGDPATFERFWFHVTGRQYSYKMFSGAGDAWSKLGDYLAAFPGEFGYVPLLFVAAGLWVLFRSSRRLFTFSVLLFLGSLFFSLNYTFDDPNFYLNTYVVTALWAAFGLSAVFAWCQPAVSSRVPPRTPPRTLSGRLTGGLSLAVRVACLLTACFPLAQNFRAVDQGGNHAVDEYARHVLASLDSGAVVVTGQYAFFTAPAYYLQLVEGERPDVLILDTQLLKFPWYYTQLERRYPWLVAGARREIDAFLRVNRRFERESALDSASFMRLVLPEYQAVVRGLMDHASRERPLFATPETRPPEEWGYQEVPTGLVFRYVRDSLPAYPPRTFTFRPLPPGAPGSRTIQSYYALGYLNQAMYHGIVQGDTATGVTLLRQALRVKPDFWPARQWLGRLTAGRM